MNDNNKSQQNITFNDIKAIISRADNFSNKITSEHISQMVIYKHKENCYKFLILFITVLVAILFLGFIIFTFKNNENLLKDILDKIIYLFLGLVSGIGIDRVVFKK